MSILMIPYRWTNPFGESNGMILNNKSAWSCFRKKTQGCLCFLCFFQIIGKLALNFKKRSKEEQETHLNSAKTCISQQLSSRPIPRKSYFGAFFPKHRWLSRKGSLGQTIAWWDRVLALVHFLSDFVHFPLETVENCYLFVWECFVVMCLFVYEKSRSEAQVDRIIQRWLIPCLLDSHSLMERGNVHITRHLIISYMFDPLTLFLAAGGDGSPTWLFFCSCGCHLIF